MIASVFGTCTSTAAENLLRDHGPIQLCITETGTHIGSLDTLASAQEETPRFAQEKKQRLAELSQLAAEICGAGLSYATKAEDDRLATKFTVPVTDFAKGKDGKIITRCRNLHKAASPLADVLAEYKITPARLKALKQKTDEYKTLSTKPREAAAARKAATKRIPAVIRQATKLLRQRLDPLMVPFKTSEPEFYAQYKAARRIVKPAKPDAKKSGTADQPKKAA